MKKQRDDEIDDGRTVSDMSGDWMPWNHPAPFRYRRVRRKKKDDETVKLTGKERRSAIRAQYLAMLPAILCVVIAFAMTFILVYLWLKP